MDDSAESGLDYLHNCAISHRMDDSAKRGVDYMQQVIEWTIPLRGGYTYYLLTGCKGRTRKYKPKVFHTARACEGCLENQGLVFPGTARAPS